MGHEQGVKGNSGFLPVELVDQAGDSSSNLGTAALVLISTLKVLKHSFKIY